MKKEIAKLDHRTIHFLPFLPARNREKNFILERAWGNEKIIIKAIETLNVYDLITFIFILKEYINNNYTEGKLKELGDREFTEIEINVKKILKERGIKNKKINRETFFNSLKRLKSIELEIFTKNNKRILTNYLIEIVADTELNNIKILANKKYIDNVIKQGIIINIDRILTYNKKEQYTILLDLYLQGTKIKKDNKYYFRNYYTNDEIEFALKLDLTDLPVFKKRQIVKNAFENLFKDKNITYIYNKHKNMWIKTQKSS
jgi:hypothetical protein